MEITKDKENLIIKIPLWQTSYDAIGETVGTVGNIVGLVQGDEIGFGEIMDWGYKGSFDYTDILVHVPYEKEEFAKLCEKLGIVFFEYPTCAYCKGVIFGCHTYDEKGAMCDDCEDKSAKKKL